MQTIFQMCFLFNLSFEGNREVHTFSNYLFIFYTNSSDHYRIRSLSTQVLRQSCKSKTFSNVLLKAAGLNTIMWKLQLPAMTIFHETAVADRLNVKFWIGWQIFSTRGGYEWQWQLQYFTSQVTFPAGFRYNCKKLKHCLSSVRGVLPVIYDRHNTAIWMWSSIMWLLLYQIESDKQQTDYAVVFFSSIIQIYLLQTSPQEQQNVNDNIYLNK